MCFALSEPAAIHGCHKLSSGQAFNVNNDRFRVNDTLLCRYRELQRGVTVIL